MESRSGLADSYTAAIDWWREAGVDLDFHDEAQALLREPESASPQAAAAVAHKQAKPAAPLLPAIGGDRADWPSTLDQFAAWWLAEPSLTDAAPRVPPRGAAQAELMVMVPMPESGDNDSLLSGNHGTLVANMLRAMQIAPDKAYIAAALPAHQPLADWPALQASGLGAVLAHHINLAAPRRLLVLGNDILPLLGLEKRQGVRELPLNGTVVELLASVAPDNLLENAKARANLWRRWLDWTGNA